VTCIFVVVQTALVSGIVPASIVPIERQFGYSASQTGLFLSINDICIVCTALPIAFFGARTNAPYAIAIACMTFALGCFLVATPQFTTRVYSPISEGSPLCPQQDADAGEVDSSGYATMVAGYGLVGVGIVPVTTLAIAFLDRFVDRNELSLYLGILNACGGVSPMLGYVLASVVSAMWVNPDTATDLEPSDSVWVGRWWFNFFFFGALGGMCAPLYALFHAKLNKTAARQQMELGEDLTSHEDEDVAKSSSGVFGGSERTRLESKESCQESEVSALSAMSDFSISPSAVSSALNPVVPRPHGNNEAQKAVSSHMESGTGGSGSGSTLNPYTDLAENALTSLVKSITRVITNPIWALMSLAAGVEIFASAAIGARLPQYLLTVYGLDSVTSSLLLAFIIPPGIGIGLFTGGYLVKRYSWSDYQTCKFCLFAAVISSTFSCFYLIGCSGSNVVGIGQPYVNEMDFDVNMPQTKLLSECNYMLPDPESGDPDPNSCFCAADSAYTPQCGIDGRTYYSACFAGCRAEVEGIDGSYSGCSCIDGGEATEGTCEGECETLPVWVIGFIFVTFFTYVNNAPAQLIIVKSVEPRDRATALAMSQMVVKLTGSIPAPLIFGYLLDSICLYEDGGNCLLYDASQMRYIFWGGSAGGKFISVLFLVAASFLLGDRERLQDNSESELKKSLLSGSENFSSSMIDQKMTDPKA
jgi:sodium-independent organic anion transporter